MEQLVFVDASPEEMTLIAYNCNDGLDNFVFASNQIFSNVELRKTPAKGYSKTEWENKWGDELDGFFDGWSNNDLYQTADGRYWAVNTIYIDGKMIPTHWREVRRKEAQI